MSLIQALDALACALLVTAGVSKLRRPGPTALVLGGTKTARWLGALEIAVGAAGFVTTLAAPAVALLYAGFAVFIVRTDAANCGCFGADEAPPGPLHVAVNVLLALSAATTAATTPTPPLAHVDPIYAVALATATYLTVALLTTLPAVFAAIAALPPRPGAQP